MPFSQDRPPPHIRSPISDALLRHALSEWLARQLSLPPHREGYRRFALEQGEWDCDAAWTYVNEHFKQVSLAEVITLIPECQRDSLLELFPHGLQPEISVFLLWTADTLAEPVFHSVPMQTWAPTILDYGYTRKRPMLVLSAPQEIQQPRWVAYTAPGVSPTAVCPVGW